MPLCLIGLGSNLGDRGRLLDEAVAQLQRHPEMQVTRQSRYFETLPAGGPDSQPAYLNAATVLQTSLPPQTLLSQLQKIETDMGRQRVEYWGPRTIDLDLLLYDDLMETGPELAVPHPRMAWRRFVLEPAAEIAAEMVHPGMGWTIARLLNHLNHTPWYLAIAGPIGVGKSCLAGKIAEKTRARLLTEQFDSARLEAFYRNPSSHAWQIELEFLEQRAAELTIGRPEWSRHDRPAVGDYWLGQSLAFASVWLDEAQMPAYLARWSELQATVVRPRLTVLLRAPLETLLARIQARGRPGEELLTIEQLRRIQRALENQVDQAAAGPVLRLNALDKNAAIVELTAAVEAMR